MFHFSVTYSLTLMYLFILSFTLLQFHISLIFYLMIYSTFQVHLSSNYRHFAQ